MLASATTPEATQVFPVLKIKETAPLRTAVAWLLLNIKPAVEDALAAVDNPTTLDALE